MDRADTVLINLSGRGDKDIFTIADALGDEKWYEFLRAKVRARFEGTEKEEAVDGRWGSGKDFRPDAPPHPPSTNDHLSVLTKCLNSTYAND
jgi:hypothetical protein